MKAVIRRLHQLERRHHNPGATAAPLRSEWRAAREMPPPCAPLPPGKSLSIAETLRMGRLRANQQNRTANSGLVT
jgi:hypothetical protein